MGMSNIDDVLLGATQAAPEAAPLDINNNDEPPMETHEEPESEETAIYDEPEEAPKPEQNAEKEVDDYGNEKASPKTYTEDEVNERINRAVRERLARLERNNPTAATQAAKDFTYDEKADGSWQEQLEQFVEKAIERQEQKRVQMTQRQREERAEMEHAAKLQSGATKFHDFMDVVSQAPITDAMTLATRAMTDPAAFLYAASKRHSTELQRIAQLDPYSQMVEMGRLEERMRRTQPAKSAAPKPPKTTREDATINEPKKREWTIEDEIAAFEQKKLDKMRRRYK